jgi:hypothetical protein
VVALLFYVAGAGRRRPDNIFESHNKFARGVARASGLEFLAPHPPRSANFFTHRACGVGPSVGMRDADANELQSTPCVIPRRLGLSRDWTPALSCVTATARNLPMSISRMSRGGDSAAKLLKRDEARR